MIPSCGWREMTFSSEFTFPLFPLSFWWVNRIQVSPTMLCSKSHDVTLWVMMSHCVSWCHDASCHCDAAGGGWCRQPQSQEAPDECARGECVRETTGPVLPPQCPAWPGQLRPSLPNHHTHEVRTTTEHVQAVSGVILVFIVLRVYILCSTSHSHISSNNSLLESHSMYIMY